MTTIINNTECLISRNTPNYIFKHLIEGLPNVRIFFSKSHKTFYLTTTFNTNDNILTNRLTTNGWQKKNNTFVKAIYRGNRT
jgi:hypothetical protein